MKSPNNVETESKLAIICHLHNLLNKNLPYICIEPSTLCAGVFGTGRCPALCQKRNINTKPATDLLLYSGLLPESDAGKVVAENLWE